MTDPGFPPPAGAQRASTVSLWVGLVTLALGALVAVLGVRAAFAADQEHQQIRPYAQARSTAIYLVTNGDAIKSATKRLQKLDNADSEFMNDMRTALTARNSSKFNDLKDSANADTEEQRALINQVMDFQAAFDEALQN